MRLNYLVATAATEDIPMDKLVLDPAEEGSSETVAAVVRASR